MTAQEKFYEIIQPDQLPYDFAQIAIPCFKKQLVKLVLHIFITFHVVVDSFHLLKKRDDLLGLFVSLYINLLCFIDAFRIRSSPPFRLYVSESISF